MFNNLFKNIFKDNCSDSNVFFKTMCSIFVFFMVLGLIINIFMSLYLHSKCDNYKKYQISQLLYTIVNVLYNCFTVYFMYKACQTCNGLWGFVYLIGIGIVFSIVSFILFNESRKRMMVCLFDEMVKMDKSN